jgi:hypothetical protein
LAMTDVFETRPETKVLSLYSWESFYYLNSFSFPLKTLVQGWTRHDSSSLFYCLLLTLNIIHVKNKWRPSQPLLTNAIQNPANCPISSAG